MAAIEILYAEMLDCQIGYLWYVNELKRLKVNTSIY